MLEIAISNLMSFVHPDFFGLVTIVVIIALILYIRYFGYNGTWGK